jgi:radical SAM superfamily enzyme YgiQ (UPF0313 family)
MKVLLIYPAFPATFWSFKYAVPFIRKRAALPPLGLLTVAALLPEDWQLRVVDLNVEALAETDLRWAEMAFVSAMAIQRRSAREVIARCKQAGLAVVGGGPLFTSEHDGFPEVDHFVLNEAELTLPPFIADLKTGCARKRYATEQFPDLSLTPAPRWDLIDPSRYATMSIQFSRGCPFNCEFCNVTVLFGRRPRQKSAAQVIAELDALVRLGWRSPVFFVDDNFIGNKAYLRDHLLPALIEWRRDKKGLPFNTEVSINLADDPELMALMVAAGFNQVFIGIETPAEESLAECGKKQNKRRDLLACVKRLQQAGLQVQGGFIVGFDSDPLSIFQRQIDFIQKSGIVTAMVGLLQAPPGTRLFERLKLENRLIGLMSGDNVDGTTNIIPKMGLGALQEGYRSILRHIYAPRHYYRRVRTFLRNFNTPGADTPLDVQRVLAFFRTCLRLGVIGKERFHYWGLLFWTLLRRPRLFSLALTLAIQGYHFRKVCERHILQPGRPAVGEDSC